MLTRNGRCLRQAPPFAKVLLRVIAIRLNRRPDFPFDSEPAQPGAALWLPHYGLGWRRRVLEAMQSPHNANASCAIVAAAVRRVFAPVIVLISSCYRPVALSVILLPPAREDRLASGWKQSCFLPARRSESRGVRPVSRCYGPQWRPVVAVSPMRSQHSATSSVRLSWRRLERRIETRPRRREAPMLDFTPLSPQFRAAAPGAASHKG